jgi:hypothetical protein
LGIGGSLVWKYLDGDGAIERALASEVDGAHAAASDEVGHFVLRPECEDECAA